MTQEVKGSVISFIVMTILWGILFQSLLFAFIFMFLLACHEMGHFVVAKKLDMDVSPPIFLPIGALINLRSMARNAKDEALMAYAGPLVGTIAAIVVAMIGGSMHSELILEAAKVGFIINLFNLIPLSPMDGGRVSMAINRNLWVAGAVLFALFIFSSPGNFFLWLIAFYIGSAAWQDVRVRQLHAASNPAYYDVGSETRVVFAVAYVVLVWFLLHMLGIM